MGIRYNEAERVFHLETPHASYLIGLVEDEGFLAHLYFGRRIPDDNMGYLLRGVSRKDRPFSGRGDQVSFLGDLPAEYPGCGLGDFREPCLRVDTTEGYGVCGLTYQSHRIFRGKPALEGLPATYGCEEECATLELTCQDPYLHLQVRLLYTVFEKLDVICRSARIENGGGDALRLQTALSACLDLDNRNFDVLSLHGNWAYERMISRERLGRGRTRIASCRGISSHQEQPFLALAEHTATQSRGQVYAMHFVYSGNFLAQAERDQEDRVRMVMGIHPDGFCWCLGPGESFQTPEAVMVYSDSGLGGMTRTLHDLYRGHLIRGPYRDKARPSLINNWEATYFDFDTKKLLEIARAAAKSGIEMLVVDDGWFGRRSNDDSSLGDWYVNAEKLPGGFSYLAQQVNALGMQLGIWVEPEMISPDSDLYREHPDYALQIPGRPGMLARRQLVLDMSRQDVRDCVYEQLYKVLSSANIAYVKWDMNRPLTDLGSPALGGRQGELAHRYTLGVYEMQERLLRDFPHILLENCCSGGGRFDPGMLYYSPQIWTSDNTEAVDRLRIQEGTALLYPLSTMGAHVAACPSHTNSRTTPFATRALVSLPGCFGYELDLTKLPEAEAALIPGQLEDYQTYGPVFRTGDYYRLASYQENGEYDALMAVSKDKSIAVLNYVHVMSRERRRALILPLEGLDENRYYRSSETGEVRSGAAWMYGGMPLPKLKGDFLGKLIILEAADCEIF